MLSKHWGKEDSVVKLLLCSVMLCGKKEMGKFIAIAGGTEVPDFGFYNLGEKNPTYTKAIFNACIQGHSGTRKKHTSSKAGFMQEFWRCQGLQPRLLLALRTLGHKFLK